MTDKIFVDSNVFMYIFSDVDEFREKALLILDSNPIISTQVVNENVYACLKRLKLTKQKSFEHGERLMSNCDVNIISVEEIHKAFFVSKKYGFSFWDALIVSSALENKCTILYTQDMQHKQVIEKTLTIINPFI
ncbi:MAG: VapC toxin family PIN domain ribonuclease [Bacteroidetes bacterium CG02_land_8_20_14_3_00_31_25]|nr:PIN domain-containing protein [Bacteroidota bacterium]PIV58685.1 MAG: VapC toxin family PIN domain ribonuclease [Bacteroidetes bacterium CG02_land_8_20_14_3_00_31_25]PIX32533.1 MAG: VapC toxin family PIN domain ribonuclease [Bacteroidetes bacterium CG_4_8_14_3_um_filter_31_14]PIY03477.1 MAG: VapC toxin family PIN domain ribonuclease [Bacteroidetes bacterium CG_4_10_14_3_um_filter_31_20]